MTNVYLDAPDEPAPRREFVEAAQRAVEVIAAHDRGDRAGAVALLGDFADDTERMLAFYVVAERSVRMLARSTGESVADAASAVALSIDLL